MSIVLKKGEEYQAQYSSSDFPALSDDWTGSVSLYTSYPGTAVFSKAMARNGNVMLLSLSIAEILNLESGVYYLVASLANSVLGVTITTLEYATVTPRIGAENAEFCLITMTILKSDGSPAGRETRTLTNSVDGVTVTLGWAGVTVTASNATADEMDNTIIGTEAISTTTNAAGYAQLSVLKGLTVTVSCPAFGRSVNVDTTGLDTVDLNSYFS